uniref:AT5g21010/F22D1_170 n=1 Tax=Arabidopsis thaliana TaxID=3702 RepID=Q94AX1_ARATH|nr:AT5g21010/F22D1_170 [Arabidopsis thaliana]
MRHVFGFLCDGVRFCLWSFHRHLSGGFGKLCTGVRSGLFVSVLLLIILIEMCW